MKTKLFWSLWILATVAAAAAASTPPGGLAFDVRQYGAIGNGVTVDTAAIQQAIDAAATAGEGTVFFPPGRYLSGSLDLKSHVTLQLDAGATLLGSPHRSDYRRVNFTASFWRTSRRISKYVAQA